MEDKIIRTNVKKYDVFHTCSTVAPPATEVCHLVSVKWKVSVSQQQSPALHASIELSVIS